MLWRLLKNSFYYRWRSSLLILVSIIMGAAITSAFLAITMDVSGKLAKELRQYGANILIQPKLTDIVQSDALAEDSYLRERDLMKIKTVFWRHNILGFCPFLYGIVTVPNDSTPEKAVLNGLWFDKSLRLPGSGEPFKTGIRSIAPWWQVEGEWLKDEAGTGIMLGNNLAKRLGVNAGDQLEISYQGKSRFFQVSGLVVTGGFEDEQIFAPLAAVQSFIAQPGKISKTLVSALTVPMDDFGKRNPKGMTRKEFEKWYCTPYVTAVAQQLEEVFQGGKAKPIWQIVEAEEKIFSKLNILLILLSVINILAASFGVTTTMSANVIRRGYEISLMKALGAHSLKISCLFLAEALLLGLLGGVLGYLGGLGIVGLIGQIVFHTPIRAQTTLFPLALGCALLVAFLGTLLPLRRITQIKPAFVLQKKI
jgi:putative ABC transport system permease protein